VTLQERGLCCWIWQSSQEHNAKQPHNAKDVKVKSNEPLNGLLWGRVALPEEPSEGANVSSSARVQQGLCNELLPRL
jgi:hypothetical protein